MFRGNICVIPHNIYFFLPPNILVSIAMLCLQFLMLTSFLIPFHLHRMATRPKRRKRTSATIVSPEDPSLYSAVQPDPSTPLQTSMMENMVSSCLAAITPALKDTVQQCIKDFHDKPNQDANSTADPTISLLEELTTPPRGYSCSTPASSSFSLTLEVNDNLRRSIHEG